MAPGTLKNLRWVRALQSLNKLATWRNECLKSTSQLKVIGGAASSVRVVKPVHKHKAPRCSKADAVRVDSPSFRKDLECLEANAPNEAAPRRLRLRMLKARRLLTGSSRKKAARSSSTDGPSQY